MMTNTTTAMQARSGVAIRATKQGQSVNADVEVEVMPLPSSRRQSKARAALAHSFLSRLTE